MADEKRNSKQDIAGPHVEGGQAKFGEPIRQGGDGLRGHDVPHESLVDQDTPGKHEPVVPPSAVTNERTPAQDAQHGADVRGSVVRTSNLANQAPEGVWRERKGPLNKSGGRRNVTNE